MSPGVPAHGDPVAFVLISLAVILLAAKLGGELASRLGQPPVLGELLFGVLLGNLALAGFPGLEPLKNDPALDMLARIGVVLLLFEIGLESTVAQMLKVGLSSLMVATLGVAAPFALGWGVGAWLLPQASGYAHAFLGATLTATSVGITARVLKDLGRSKSPEARVILGAAVIDDVIGLVILAVVTGVIAAADAGLPPSYAGVAWIVGKAALFIAGSVAAGAYISPKLFSLALRLRQREVLLAVALPSASPSPGSPTRIGLAPIVGAFAAGLILEEVHYRKFLDRGEPSLEVQIHPLSSSLVPVFLRPDGDAHRSEVVP